MIIDFTQAVLAGKTAAEETRELAAELALAHANGTWGKEQEVQSVQGLSVAARYMLQVVTTMEAVNAQMLEMFGQPSPPTGAPPATPPPPPPGAAATLLNLILKGAEVERAEKKSPRGKWPPAGRRRR